MRRSVGLIAILWALSAGTASAQWTATPGIAPGYLGVDVWSPVYPRTPPATVTHPATGRTAPQFDEAGPSRPAGVAAGNIIIYPSVTAGAFYDDNVFALSTGQLSDWAYFVRPEIAWRSNNWANAQVGGAAFVEKRWYQRFSSEDQVNGGAVVGGTVQPDADTQLVGRLQYLHAHEDRGTSDTILTTFAKPLSYDQVEAAGAINRRFNRFWTSLGAAAAWFNFETPFLPGFGPVSQAYRDGYIVRAPVRVGYVVAPLTSVFVEASGHWRDFDVNSFDSSGYRVVGGMLFEPGPGSRIKGEFFAGYMNQDYSGIGFQTVSTWTYGALMAFLVTQNVTAVVEGRRDAKEASLSGGVIPGDGVSVIETLAAARVDWAIWPNVVVGGGVAYLVDEYLLAGRTDRSWSPLFSAKYFVNRHLTLAFDYRHLNFDSSGLLVPGYFRNVYLFSANFRI